MKNDVKKMECAPWPKSCLQVYTGNGKGKTTASLGLTVRAVGRGLKVYIGQFMKKSEYGELVGVKLLGDSVTLEQFGTPECISMKKNPDKVDLDAAGLGLARCREVLLGGEYNIVILDEINVAVHFGLIGETDLLDLVDERPSGVELVCTGRYASEPLVDRADLVTEMMEIKHPYNTETLVAREGIER
jgi:cob(I)alamin adenosyltransferase